MLLLELRLESLELLSDLSLPPSSGACLPSSGGLAPASGTCLPPGTRSSTATLFSCPPAPPEVGELPVLLLELRLESLEQLSVLSLPSSSGVCLPPSGGLTPASGTCIPPGTRSSTTTLFSCPLAPPESDSVDLAFLEISRSVAELEDDECALLMPDKDSGCPLTMVELVGAGDPDSRGGFGSPQVGEYRGLDGL